MKTKTILKKVASMALVMALACSLFAGVNTNKIAAKQKKTLAEGKEDTFNPPKLGAGKEYYAFKAEHEGKGVTTAKAEGGKVKVKVEYTTIYKPSQEKISCFFKDKNGKKRTTILRITIVPQNPYIKVAGKKIVLNKPRVSVTTTIKMKSEDKKTIVLENALFKDMILKKVASKDNDCLIGDLKSKGDKPMFEIETKGCAKGTKDITFNTEQKKGDKTKKYTVKFKISIK